MIGNRNSQHSFSQIPDVKTGRSMFDKSFSVKDTLEFDYLNPIFCDEVLPGDTINLSLSTFTRLATQKVPIMDNMYIDFFWFFVPNRLIYEKWEKMMGSQDNPGDSIDFLCPDTVAPAVTGFAVGGLYDKFGLPTGVPLLQIDNHMPIRGYNLIWNTWFRDENLQDSVVVDLDEGPDDPADYVLLKTNKKHDYFTSALPFLQKGTAVQIPLGDTAPVLGIGAENQVYPVATTNVYDSAGNNPTYAPAKLIDGDVSNEAFYVVENPADPGFPWIRADLSSATAATINQLRQAFQVQSLLELDARGGTRYVEILRAHFNVVSPDFRLQRPEFLGSSTTKINSHPVTQTSPTSGANALAQLGAFATQSTQGQNVGFSKSFVEHGHVIGLMRARADITYQQGLNRMWSRSTRYDFFWPKLQDLGEQAILNKEIFAAATAPDEDVFGYQERYAEYKYTPSQIRGEFRSTFATPLDQWHMAQEFSVLPALNTDFIESSTPIERALAVSGDVHLLFDAFFSYKSARPMATHSVPSSLGRF